MKTKTLAALALLAFTGIGYSASYTLTNVGASLADSNGFGNSAGIAFQNSASPTFAGPGVVAFGTFSISDAQISGALAGETLVSAFSGFGSSSTGAFVAPGLTGARGTFSRNSTGTVGTELNGDFIYLFVGNGTTFANSTEFAVLKTSLTFNSADDETPTPVSLVVSAANSTVLVGGTTSDIRVTNADGTATLGFTTVAVPEPSAALLGLLGAVGLIRRRR